MSLRIVNKNSTVQDKVPLAADLEIGEIAVNANVNSPAAYIKDSAGNVVKIAGSGSVGDDWTRTGTALSPKTAGDTIQFSAGTAALPGITPVGNADTGIYSPGANQVAISTSGTQRLTTDTAAVTSTLPVVHPLGTASTPSLTFTSDLNTGIYSPGADQLALSTNGVQRINIEADGDINIDSGGVFYDATNNRLAIGTTSPATLLHVNTGSNATAITVAASTATGGQLLIGTGAKVSGQQSIVSSGNGLDIATLFGVPITFYTSDTERARIDASGRLLVGTSSVTGIPATLNVIGGNNTVLHTQGANADSPFLFLSHARGTGTQSVNAQDGVGAVAFVGYDGTNALTAARIEAFVDGTPGANDMPGRLVFSTTADGASSPTERMRITSNGAALHYAATSVVYAASNSAAGTTDALFVGKYGAGDVLGGTNSFNVYTNGNVVNTNNSYGSLSDIKLKENIVDANSQWDDIKALQVRNYNFKEGQTHTQIGLVAQEVELVSPGLVSETPDRDEDGNDLGTVTKSVNYSVLYMKAVKALQEAMERIETLEAKVAALESA